MHQFVVTRGLAQFRATRRVAKRSALRHIEQDARGIERLTIVRVERGQHHAGLGRWSDGIDERVEHVVVFERKFACFRGSEQLSAIHARPYEIRTEHHKRDACSCGNARSPGAAFIGANRGENARLHGATLKRNRVMVVAVRSRACLRKFELRVAGVSGELRTQGFVEQFRALHQIAATVAGDEMRVAAESLIAREFIIEIRRERRLQLTTSKCGVLELILGGSHGVSRTFRKFCRKFAASSVASSSQAQSEVSERHLESG